MSNLSNVIETKSILHSWFDEGSKKHISLLVVHDENYLEIIEQFIEALKNNDITKRFPSPNTTVNDIWLSYADTAEQARLSLEQHINGLDPEHLISIYDVVQMNQAVFYLNISKHPFRF